MGMHSDLEYPLLSQCTLRDEKKTNFIKKLTTCRESIMELVHFCWRKDISRCINISEGLICTQ